MTFPEPRHTLPRSGPRFGGGEISKSPKLCQDVGFVVLQGCRAWPCSREEEPRCHAFTIKDVLPLLRLKRFRSERCSSFSDQRSVLAFQVKVLLRSKKW